MARITEFLNLAEVWCNYKQWFKPQNINENKNDRVREKKIINILFHKMRQVVIKQMIRLFLDFVHKQISSFS